MDEEVIPTYDFTVHRQALDKLCLICGSLKSVRNNKFFPIDDMMIWYDISDVESTFLIKVNLVKDIHPSAICSLSKMQVFNLHFEEKEKGTCLVSLFL